MEDLCDWSTLNNRHNYYKEARDSCLKSLLPDYPDVHFYSFEFSFSIRSGSKNGDIVYIILDSVPQGNYVINANEIEISFTDEQCFIDNLQLIIDIHSVVGKWSSLVIRFNNVKFSHSDFRYLCDFFEEHYEIKHRFFWSNAQEIRKKYKTVKRIPRKNKAQELPKLELSNQNLPGILKNTLNRYLEIYGQSTSSQVYSLSENEAVLVLEDNLVVDFCLHAESWTKDDNDINTERDWSFPQIVIQDLTPNMLFKFNYAGFKRNFTFQRVSMAFFKFSGAGATDWDFNRFGFVNKALPFLTLQQRLDNYPGETYHFVILIMEDRAGIKRLGIGYTKGLVHTFVLKVCKELEEKNSRLPELSCLPYSENKEFMEAFLSWKGEKKRWRLENKFSYYYVDRQIKKESEIFTVPRMVLDIARKEGYSGEYGYYSKPLNRWKSEELVYTIAKQLYQDYLVIYQYRPHFLATESGSMSYDIYICGLKVAIEYQGKQHFEPVEYFGGEENHKKQKQRDQLKAELSKENGVKLVYINYWESITPELVKQRVEQ